MGMMERVCWSLLVVSCTASCGTQYADPVLGGESGAGGSNAGAGGVGGSAGTPGTSGSAGLADAGIGDDGSAGQSVGGAGGSGGDSAGGSAGQGVAGGGGRPPYCEAAADAIWEKVPRPWCTSVVRVDYETSDIKGYRVFCDGQGFTEDSARKLAETVSGKGICNPESSIAGEAPEDDFVFFSPASDHCACCVVDAPTSGYVLAVSKYGGMLLGGDIGNNTPGGLFYPTSWNPPSELAVGCGWAWEQDPEARGFDIAHSMPDSPARPLSQSEIKPVMDIVWNTALPKGLSHGMYFAPSLVLLYSPDAGKVDNAEWIVFLNTFYLE